MNRKINWGILGTGRIANTFVSDLSVVENSQVVAVGSRSAENAKQFADNFNISQAFGSYEELVKASEVDVIYIGTPHTFHFEHALLCLQHNKHVLCEKPVTVNAGQFEILIKEAKARNLIFMEAMWTPFLPAVQAAQRWLQEGKIGPVQLIQANFGIKGNTDPKGRLLNPDLAGGALLDIGIYPLTIIEMFAQSDLDNFSVDVNFTDTGVDENIAIQLNYKNGIKAQAASHVNTQFINHAVIYGTLGYIEIPLFWMAKKAILQLNNKETEIFEDKSLTMGYNWEAKAVAEDILNGRKENAIMPLSRSMQMMKLMDSIRERIKLFYPFE